MKKQRIIKIISVLLSLILLASCSSAGMSSISSAVTEKENQNTIVSSDGSNDETSSLPVLSDKDNTSSQNGNGSVSSKDETVSNISSDYTSSQPIIHVQKNISVGVVDVNLYTEIPKIKLRWSSITEKDITIDNQFTIQYYKDNQWVECIEEFDYGYERNTVLSSDSNGVTYSLWGYDLSKVGKYRIYGDDILNSKDAEFVISRGPKLYNIFFDAETFEIGSGRGTSLFSTLCEKGTEELPLMKLEDKTELQSFIKLMRDNFKADVLEESLEKYDDSFFSKKTVLVLYQEGNLKSHTDRVIGVEDNEAGKCKITLHRFKERQIQLPLSRAYVSVITVDKQRAQRFNKYEISYCDSAPTKEVFSTAFWNGYYYLAE